ncbi:amidohydrolase family protein [Microlunatus speluncae]|uniref:amidohydrolase family protein n=1 Tax=Microlunatus speluncae TaxID=2594267 RepID=UPI001266300C|nr:amidohydrolase family protein [Microlunatus speluncae]
MLAAALAVPVLSACGPERVGARPAGGFAFEGVRVFDGERVIGSGTVLVSGAELVGVGERIEIPTGYERIDGTGRTLLPGLIDAHSHLMPSTDPPRFGVTTELELGTVAEQRGDVRTQRASTAPTARADLWSAGTLVTVPGGHGTQAFPGLATLGPNDDPAAFVDQRIAEGADHLKLVIEHRDHDGSPMPTLSDRQLRALITAAAERGLRTLAHVTRTDDALLAIDAGISGLAHVCADRPVDRTLIDRALDRGVFMISTSAYDLGTARRREGDRSIYADPRIAPRLSGFQRAILDTPFPESPWMNDSWLDRGRANTRILRAAGVPILAGTDAPIPGLINGVSLLACLESLVGPGLDPVTALTTATAAPADAFGLTDRGRLQAGHRADLVLVAGDPTTKITDLRAIEAVWKNGHPIDLNPTP